jgi:heme ABC exporter ATP-binding subunit CcmA
LWGEAPLVANRVHEASFGQARASLETRMTPPMSVIHLSNLVVTLAGFPALSGIDLQVQAGELLVIKGPNGAGKTTLLRVCGGLLAPTSGSGHVLGHELGGDRRRLRRNVGMLAHANFLYDDLTVEDNIRFAVRAGRGDVAGVPAALKQLGLDGRLQKLRTGSCSAGQRRRTALAALVVRQPKLWLLDEPHAGLDADSRDLLDAIVRNAVRDGATVLLSSHEADRASALATRTVTVAGGFVVSDVVSDTGDVSDQTTGRDRSDTSSSATNVTKLAQEIGGADETTARDRSRTSSAATNVTKLAQGADRE